MKLYQEFFESNISDENKIKKRTNVAGGVLMKKGENDEDLVLLIRRSKDDHWPGFYEIPRGGCEDNIKNESLRHCCIREVKEETGLDVTPIAFIDKFSYIADGGTRESTEHNFLCKLNNEKQKIKLSKEHDDYLWISSVGEAELYVMPEIKKTISKVLNINNPIVNYPENIFKDDTIKEYLERVQK